MIGVVGTKTTQVEATWETCVTKRVDGGREGM
jgi:hypothetical protein